VHGLMVITRSVSCRAFQSQHQCWER